jgi:hypothetical protein
VSNSTRILRGQGQKPMKTNIFTKLSAHLVAMLLATAAVLSVPETAQAQVHVTGPLAGAPAVRKLRLYREGRFEMSPNVSFTLLDEYRRNIFFGLRLNYGITDWLAVGAWGGIGSSLMGFPIDTALTGEIEEVNDSRHCRTTGGQNGSGEGSLQCKLTEVNLSSDFPTQLASIDWMAAPQLTAVPFRGKLGLFNSIFVDADLYLFAGAAFVGIRDRADCEGTCTEESSFETVGRVEIAPTFGLGFTFYINHWTAVGAEYRAVPFSVSNAGFDVAGRGQNNAFPDGNISAADREFKFNQMLTISFNMYLPMQNKVSE